MHRASKVAASRHLASQTIGQRLRHLRKEDGYVIALTALLILPIMAFTGFAVDLGAWYGRAAQIQRATDAAALAGARYMPNFGKSSAAAIEEAQRNGYVSGVDGITVTVSKIPGNNAELKVEIHDAQVEQFFSKVYRNNVDIKRHSVGEFIRPIPMGSPRNHLGTMQMNPGTNYDDNIWLAVQGYCSRNEHGDRITPRVDANGGDSDDQGHFAPCVPGGASIPSGNVVENSEYSPEGYFYAMDTVEGVTGSWTIQAYDLPACRSLAGSPNIDSASMPYRGAGVSGSLTYDDYEGIWSPTRTYNSDDVVRYNGRAFEAIRTTYNDPPSTSQTDPDWRVGSRQAFEVLIRDRDRPDDPTSATVLKKYLVDPARNHAPNSPVTVDGEVYDGTIACRTSGDAQSSAARGWQDLYTFSGAQVANPNVFYVQIRPVIPDENYIQEGNNWFGLRLAQNGSYSVCSSDPTVAPYTGPNSCMQLYGLSHLGVYATLPAGQPEFFLASITDQYNGHILEVELFDSAEGADKVELLDPLGNPVTFTWEIPCKDGSYTGGSCTTGENAPAGGYGPVTANYIDVSGNYNTTYRPWGSRTGQSGKYSDRIFRLTHQLPDDIATDYGLQTWWKIRYTASSSIGDRTTWSVQIKGDPVRLVPN